MKSAKKLSLKKETLSALTSDEMSGLAGAQDTTILSRVIQCPDLSRNIQPCPTRGNVVCDRVSVLVHPCPTSDYC